MDNDLDGLLRRLGDMPPDRMLDTLTDDIGASIAARAAAQRQTWGIRGTAALVIASAGVMLSASTAALAAPQPASAFAVWSSLAPSTLLESGH